MTSARIQERVFPTGRLKTIASKLPKEHALRQLLTVETDQLAPEEFGAKLHTWLRVLALGALFGSIVGSPNQFSSFGTHIPLFL
jgi:hypothetical protein